MSRKTEVTHDFHGIRYIQELFNDANLEFDHETKLLASEKIKIILKPHFGVSSRLTAQLKTGRRALKSYTLQLSIFPCILLSYERCSIRSNVSSGVVIGQWKAKTVKLDVSAKTDLHYLLIIDSLNCI